jgi:pimeloyl-ACP methyl ester carboxylesterase
MERATVNGVELEYDVRGSGEPLLLIHGSHIAGAMEPLMKQSTLTDRCQLIHYHRRGFCDCSPTDAPVPIAKQAADAAGLLTHLGITRAHIAGHSYGGVIALQLAVDRPELVHSLALLEPALLMVPSAEATLGEMAPAIEAYEAGKKDEAVAIFLSVVSGLDWESCREVMESAGPGNVEQAIADADTFFACELPALGEWTFGPAEAAAIKQPVLSVVGADSIPVFAEGRDLLHSWFPQTEDFDLQGAGHLLQVQQPEAMARGLADFVDQHPLVPEVMANAKA